MKTTAILLFAAFANVSAETNTNKCLPLLGGLQVCTPFNIFKIGQCCDAIRAYTEAGCFCNPALDFLIGDQVNLLRSVLQPVCRLVHVFSWWETHSCKHYETHEYGCSQNDMEIDAGRLESTVGFNSLFLSATSDECMDVQALIADMKPHWDPNGQTFTVPYGVGLYEGFQDVAEYVALAFSRVNHGMWNMGIPDPQKSFLQFATDGGSIAVGGYGDGDFANGCITYNDYYQSQTNYFNGCSTKISKVNVEATPDFGRLAGYYVLMASEFKRYGAEDICKYHEEYCTGSLRQYADKEECLNYVSSLPKYSERCGPNRPLSGRSLPCLLKHKLLITANPILHCAHIGKGVKDMNGNLKCDDDKECSEPPEAFYEDAPLVPQPDEPVPAVVLGCARESNINWEEEPFGCAFNNEADP